MLPSTIVDQLRAIALYPTLSDEGIRLYGDLKRLTPELRAAIQDNRAGIIEHLQADGQHIAYDLIDLLTRDGWQSCIVGSVVGWTRGVEATTDPMPTPALSDALNHYRAEVVRVLLDVPDGCKHRHECAVSGICKAEIRESGCRALGHRTKEKRRDT